MRIMARYGVDAPSHQANISNAGRVFPRCAMISQAIASTCSWRFFRRCLIMVGFATSRIGGRTSLFDLIRDLTEFLPPGSPEYCFRVLVKRGPEAWKACARWMDGNPAGGFASDAAADGRNPQDLWRSGAAGISAQASSRIGAALGDDRAVAGGGDTGRAGKAHPENWLSHELGTASRVQGWLVGFLSGNGDHAGFASAHR